MPDTEEVKKTVDLDTSGPAMGCRHTRKTG